MIKIGFLWSLLLLFAFEQAIGQAPAHKFAPFEKAGVVRIFGDEVEVREGPEVTYLVRAILPIGTEVQVLERSQDWLKPVDYTDVWYKIRGLSPEGRTVVGYVWGGFLSDASFEADLDGDAENEILLISNRTWNACELWEHEKWDSRLELKVVKEGIIWATATESWDYVSNINLETYAFPSENGPVFGFFLDFDWRRCDSGHSRQYYLLRSGDVTPQFSILEELENAKQTCKQVAIFPENPLGQPNEVMIHSTCTMKEDGSKGYSSKRFVWDGRNFQSGK